MCDKIWGKHYFRYEDSFNFNSKSVRDVEALSKVVWKYTRSSFRLNLIFQVPGLNPLGFHPELLADRILPKLSTITRPFTDEDKKEDFSHEDEEQEEEGEEDGDDGDDDQDPDYMDEEEDTVLGRENEDDEEFVGAEEGGLMMGQRGEEWKFEKKEQNSGCELQKSLSEADALFGTAKWSSVKVTSVKSDH